MFNRTFDNDISRRLESHQELQLLQLKLNGFMQGHVILFSDGEAREVQLAYHYRVI